MEPPVAASSSAERSGTIAIRRVEGSNAELTCVADVCTVDNPAGDGVEVLERHLSTDEAGMGCSTMARPRTHTGHLLDHGGWSTLLRICSQTSATSNQRWCRCFKGGLPRSLPRLMITILEAGARPRPPEAAALGNSPPHALRTHSHARSRSPAASFVFRQVGVVLSGMVRGAVERPLSRQVRVLPHTFSTQRLPPAPAVPWACGRAQKTAVGPRGDGRGLERRNSTLGALER